MVDMEHVRQTEQPKRNKKAVANSVRNSLRSVRIMSDYDEENGNIGVQISQARLRANHIMSGLSPESQAYLQAEAYRAKIAYYSGRLREHMRLHQYHEAMRVKSILRQFCNKLDELYNSPMIQNKL